MGKTHQNCQPPFFSCLFFPTIYFCQNVVEVVIAWKGQSMGRIRIGQSTQFQMSCFDFMGKKNTWNRMSVWLMCSHIMSSFGFTFWGLQDVLLIHHSLHSRWKLFGNWALPVCIPRILQVSSLGETVIFVLQRYLELQSVWDPVARVPE